MDKSRRKIRTKNIYDEYRRLLEMPELTIKEIEKIRQNLRSIVATICEYVWKKKFY